MTTTAPAVGADLAPAPDDVDGRAIVTIRMLAADAVEAAGCGHPGLPMGMAAAAYTLWSRFLQHDPTRPAWADRDRFVLSAGHGSMLLYSLLHLFGYDVSLDDLRAFRQWGSKTPGHPEYGHTPGVETTTGPLGQGLGNAVGMALAERMLAERYGPSVVDHRTWVLASDGDLMEGISHEAASLAGHLGLGRLVVLYDDNHITIDGPAEDSCSDDTCARFASYGWHVARVDDGNDVEAIDAALRAALAEPDHPSLIAVRTHIGFGAPTVQDTSDAHGAALGAGEIARTRERFGWPTDVSFHVPDDVRRRCRGLGREAGVARTRWEVRLALWAEEHPAAAAQWRRTQSGLLPDGVDLSLPVFTEGESLPTRKASGVTLQALAPLVPELVGGSADLAGSTNTSLGDGTVRAGRYAGREIAFGVREHAMAAACNGMALHGGLRPFCSTFLVFSDYLRPSLRLAALMGLPVVFVFTHDSIGLGEDGPTHQPVEHLAALRAIPNLAVIRPADAQETAEAWAAALRRTGGPTALILSRQGLPVLAEPPTGAIERTGAVVVCDGGPVPDIVLVATGSEVSVALTAAQALSDDGVSARVVSVPWRERFARLDPERAATILPPDTPRVIVEAGSPQGWEGLARPDGRIIGLERFGASAPGSEVLARLGFTSEAVRSAAHEILTRAANGKVAPWKG